MRGDVVLFLGAANPQDWLIEWATKGPYTHVELDLGNGKFVGEHSSGIVVHDGIIGRNVVAFTPPHADIEAGMAWVDKVVAEQAASKGEAHEYGWLDITAEALKVLGVKFGMQSQGEWDCSDFVTRYLIVAGAAGPLGSAAKNPGTVSPNDLARAYGILH